jgi:hypothetical protein
MGGTLRIECKCGKKLSARVEMAGKRVKCPGCGAAVAVTGGVAGPARAAKGARGPYPYWRFLWGDWTDTKRPKACFVVTDDAVWTAPLEGEAADAAEEALDGGAHPKKALGEAAFRLPFEDMSEVRADLRGSGLEIDHLLGGAASSAGFTFASAEERDEVVAALRERLPGWGQSRERMSAVKAAAAPLIWIGVLVPLCGAAAGLSYLWQDIGVENNFIGMIRAPGPLGWAAFGAALAVGFGCWMVARMVKPPVLLYLRPGAEGG